ncbi:hypothetical protein [Chitinophaga sp.]|uniref:hypothetical protein n=1 Tax=Chitinophaga sp. TaxID=1869181 RepID=UPI0031D131B0
MKKIPKLLMAVAMFVMPMIVNAQKLKVIEGDLSLLKGTYKLNTEFDYEHVGVGSYADENDYIARKTEDYNKKEPGRGDKWAKAWKNDRPQRFEPKFNQLFTEYSGMTAGKFPKAKYTLIFKTTFIEPGYNVGVVRKNARLNGEAWIVETGDHNKVIAKIKIDKAPGRVYGGFDFDTGLRIQESYAAAGKALGKKIKKKAK